MFRAVGRFVHRFRWIVIAVWVVLFGVSVAATPYLGGVLKGSFANPNSPSHQASTLIQEKFEQGPTQMLVVFKSDSLQATDPEFQAAQMETLERLQAADIPYLQSTMTYADTGSDLFLSKDGHSTVAVLNFDASIETVQQEVPQIREVVAAGALEAYVTGEPAVNADLTTHSFRDLQKVELYGLPVALIALLFVFGSLVSAALPVVTGGVAVTVTLGGMFLIGHATDMSIFSMNTATLLGLAVAIDYALFFVARFREELHKGASVEEAVVTTTTHAGRSIFYSGIAVVVGVAGLLFFPSPGLRSVGVGGALVVFFSVLASITFIPALLSVLGRRVNSLAVIPIRDIHASRFWNGWTRVLLRRPWASIVIAVVLIALVVAPALKMDTQMTTAATLPKSAESRAGIEILDEEFDRAALSPISVLLTWEDGGDIDMIKAGTLFMYGQELTALEGTESVLSPFTLPGMDDAGALVALWPQFESLLNDPDGFVVPEEGIALGEDMTISAAEMEQFKQLIKGSIAPGAALFQVTSSTLPGTEGTQELVSRILDLEEPGGFVAYTAGEAAHSFDFFKELSDWFPWVIAWVLGVSFLVFVILLRSIVLPAVAVVVNALTIGTSWGLLVLLFQGDTFSMVLRVTSTGGIEVIIPIVLLCVLFGITMDYAVFMLTRTQECWQKTGDNRLSVGLGLIQTGRVIVSAALLVVIVTGAFAFTSIKATKMLGLGIALAIILDTVLIRMTLLPSVMAYLGRFNWWWPQRLTNLVRLPRRTKAIEAPKPQGQLEAQPTVQAGARPAPRVKGRPTTESK